MCTPRLPLLICMAFSCTIIFAQNVGIGTTTPTKARLQIVSAQNVSPLSISSGDNTTGISLSTPLGLSAAVNFNLYYGNAYRYMTAGYGGNLAFNPANGILSYSTSTTKGNAGDLAFFNSANVYIDSNGYVGLGTSAPKTRLHTLSAVIGANSITPATGYILSVGGKIICEELKVQLNGAWPDYVFEKDYPLLSLDQLEQLLMEEKHLPGIPSAADVDNQQGVEIGDLQKKMLEKMEELYRYLFEMNKENKELKEKIAELEKQLAKISTQ